jgi:hypothetical protein
MYFLPALLSSNSFFADFSFAEAYFVVDYRGNSIYTKVHYIKTGEITVLWRFWEI